MSPVLPIKEHASKVFDHLFKLLPDQLRGKPQIILLNGEQTPYRNDTDREMTFRQESNFFYLSNINIPDSHIVLFLNPSGVNKDINPNISLFVPPPDPLLIMWSIPPPAIDGLKTDYKDIASIHPTPTLIPFLSALLKSHPDAVVHTLPLWPGHPFPAQPAELQNLLLGGVNESKGVVTQEYLLRSIHLARLIKTPQEIALIRQANAISSRAHEVIMRLLGKGVKHLVFRDLASEKAGIPALPGEWLIEKEAEAEAVFVASCRREGAIHQAYRPIVAASTRAATLHYCCNDREFAWGPIRQHGNGHAHDQDILLIDAGSEWDNYASDITRTMPVGNGGKFTSEAREIYTIVLKMQQESLSALKPGIHWDEIQYLCHRILISEFIKLGIFKGKEEEILQSGVSAAFFPHGVGHSLGLDVHDVPSASKPVGADGKVLPEFESELARKTHPSFYSYLRLRRVLEAGMVVTVEPGCYFSSHLLAPIRNSNLIDHTILARYEDVGGVRIEDVVWITSRGCENLTTVGSSVDWVEKVCAGDI
ncbi:hypothetical protein Clacol_008408 [Clathrus columnatus]|uniref:Aminopeptidase P N-terminal domain-containing protein n=1 Tax=Clathrus columnatus TaxID=1419009 RepID=A0AAV5AKX8_9AGAM|nr:hypothetical protein Clacol_008408 [Clathrus columnatus]